MYLVLFVLVCFHRFMYLVRFLLEANFHLFQWFVKCCISLNQGTAPSIFFTLTMAIDYNFGMKVCQHLIIKLFLFMQRNLSGDVLFPSIWPASDLCIAIYSSFKNVPLVSFHFSSKLRNSVDLILVGCEIADFLSLPENKEMKKNFAISIQNSRTPVLFWLLLSFLIWSFCVT